MTHSFVPRGCMWCGDPIVWRMQILPQVFCDAEAFWFYRILLPRLLFPFTLFLLLGCASRHTVKVPPNTPSFPQGADCGMPVSFDNGETWVYPCWPEKPVPRCVKGCQSPQKETHGCLVPDTSISFVPLEIDMTDAREKNNPRTIIVKLDVCMKHGEFRVMK